MTGKHGGKREGAGSKGSGEDKKMVSKRLSKDARDQLEYLSETYAEGDATYALEQCVIGTKKIKYKKHPT